ncbi:MAG TPA: DUF1223 domain-containing protein [Beijerinckiaceae bacterium]|jgi:hypothetical protein
MRLFSIRGLLSAALVLASVLPAAAEVRAVLELFTSQGCSSCPPADRLLTELAREPDVVALTFPVDYWDYLGWKDTLAHAAFTARQRAYAQGRGDRQVFTPQMVVNGKAQCVGSDRARVTGAIAQGKLPVTVRVSEAGERIAVEIGAGTGAGEAWLLPVSRSREVAIGRGENRGRSATYANVVRGLVRLGGWHGAPARFEVPASAAQADGADSYVVLLQAATEGRPGEILAAAKGPGL